MNSHVDSNGSSRYSSRLIFWLALAAGFLWLAGLQPQAAEASYPGANGRFVFHYTLYPLYSMNADGSDLQQLTPGAPDQDFDPEWSPDGQRIAFHRGFGDIYVMNADGTDPVAVTPGIQPTWSPDGMKLAYRNPGAGSIESIDLATHVTTTLYSDNSTDGRAFEPEWSPDGTELAFSTVTDDLVRRLRILDLDSGLVRTLGPPSTFVMIFDWFPDSQRLLVWSRYGDFDIVSRDGASITPLNLDFAALGVGYNDSPVVSPDGEQIAFPGFSCNPCQGNLFTHNLSTGVTTQATHFNDGGQQFANFSWQPLVAGDPNTTDSDGDGLVDAVDGSPAVPSAGFSDGQGTAGTVGANPGALTVDIVDAAAPDGVQVTIGSGTGQVTLSVCGGFTLKLNAGTTITLTCGSVRVKVLSGQAQVVLAGGTSVVTIPAGVQAKVSDAGGGSYTVENLGGGNVSVSVDGTTGTIAPGPTTRVATWRFAGFSQPVDNNGVLNKVKAGQAIPIKWRLLTSSGLPITNLANATITAKSLNCSLGSTVDQIEELVAGSSGLQNLGNGYYQLNWKTPTSYAGSCKTMQLDLNDGVVHDALFQFTK